MDEKDRFTTNINVRVGDELRGDLERLASADHRPLANYVRVVLEQHVAQKREAGELEPVAA